MDGAAGDPGRSGDGFRMDDEKMAYPFYEKSKELGVKVFSVHKGFASQSRTLAISRIRVTWKRPPRIIRI